MSKTNSLGSHHGESKNSRADKMSGIGKSILRFWRNNVGSNTSNKVMKAFYSAKRRMFLKNDNNWDKI